MTGIYEVKKRKFTCGGMLKFSLRDAGILSYQNDTQYQSVQYRAPLSMCRHAPFSYSRVVPYTIRMQPYST